MGTTNILDMNNRISALEKDVTSVEEAVDEKGTVFYTSEYNVTVITQQHGSDVQIHFTPTGIDYYLNDQKIWTISKNS